MTNNVYGFDNANELNSLAKHLGGIDECKRLGFVYTDESGVMHMSAAGWGYSLQVRARSITNVAEAFAAGYQFAHEEKNL